jgi:hypothetical protein
MANYHNFLSFTIPLTPTQQDWAIEEFTREPTDEDEQHPGVVCERQRRPHSLA